MAALESTVGFAMGCCRRRKSSQKSSSEPSEFSSRFGRAAAGADWGSTPERSSPNVSGSFEDELKETDETLTEDDEWSICSLADPVVEGKKNLNDASRKELSKIPTIGKVLSKRIHEGKPYRDWIDVRALPQVGPVRIAELQKAFYLVEHTHS